MWVTPYFLQGAHGCVRGGKTGCDVVVIAEVVGYERAEVSECPREADKAVGDGEVLGLIELVMCGMFAFSLPWVVFVVVISGVYLLSFIGVVGGK